MDLKDILEKYKSGEIDLTEALEQFPKKGIEEMGFATIDTNRQSRTGLPEVIYASGKTVDQVQKIAERMYQKGIDVLATRVIPEMYDAIKQVIPGAEYNELAKTISYHKPEKVNSKGLQNYI